MKALLLLAFGGPRSLEEVEFLLARLFGRKPSHELLERVKERYRLIGGSWPLPVITERQARALEERLNARGYSFKSFVGMRYSQPLIEETLNEILQDGIKEVVAIPMAPFRSRFSTGAYKEELNRANKISGEKLRITFIEGWHSHPLFLKMAVEKVEEGLKQFTPEERKRVHLIFTAHSLPESIVGNDPYIDDMKESVDEVLKRIGLFPWHMAFQSKGGGPGKWIGPDVESVLSEISKIGVKEVLIIPIGFVSDHIEILYDIDILYKEKAESLGMVLKRTPSLNYSEGFIETLATIVEENFHL
ncbi:MAG: ferrochelatase [Candidatus Eisenbacteria bacterium]|nr:ferrochelatase [Candidatus Eisenbacteria bacterium]